VEEALEGARHIVAEWISEKTIPSHRMLAIRRGATESVLRFLIDIAAVGGSESA